LTIKINGNGGAHQEVCFNKSQKETAPFQHEFPI